MESSLRVLSELLQTHGNKEAMLRIAYENPMFHDVPAIVFRVFNELTNSQLTIPKKEEHNDMCLALEQLIEEGRNKGRKEMLEKLRAEREKVQILRERDREKHEKDREKLRAEREKVQILRKKDREKREKDRKKRRRNPETLLGMQEGRASLYENPSAHQNGLWTLV